MRLRNRIYTLLNLSHHLNVRRVYTLGIAVFCSGRALCTTHTP